MPVPGSTPSSAPATGQWFATTHWSIVLTAKAGDSPEASEALEKLCRVYWPPFYSFIRREGHDATEAQDLTQGFFAETPEEGLVVSYDGRRLAIGEEENGKVSVWNLYAREAIPNLQARQRHFAPASIRNADLGLLAQDCRTTPRLLCQYLEAEVGIEPAQ